MDPVLCIELNRDCPPLRHLPTELVTYRLPTAIEQSEGASFTVRAQLIADEGLIERKERTGLDYPGSVMNRLLRFKTMDVLKGSPPPIFTVLVSDQSTSYGDRPEAAYKVGSESIMFLGKPFDTAGQAIKPAGADDLAFVGAWGILGGAVCPQDNITVLAYVYRRLVIPRTVTGLYEQLRAGEDIKTISAFIYAPRQEPSAMPASAAVDPAALSTCGTMRPVMMEL